MKKLYTLLLLSAICLFSCSKGHFNSFVHVENGQFIKDGNTYYYVGTNFWYGAILASQGQGGDTLRLAEELDYLKSIGVENLRVLVGSDGQRGVNSKVEPTLQTAPGVYNDTILAGLDRFMYEIGKRGMSAVLYLNNSWEWSGGYGKYLEWAGEGVAPIPALEGWSEYMDFVSHFVQCDSAKALFASYVKDIISRTNRYTGVKYTEDPAIFSWQIGNEPRAFSQQSKEPFALWIQDVAKLIKELDPNHMISTGSEGMWGCENDIELWNRIHSYPEISYTNIHIWPYNWSWVKEDSLSSGIGVAIENTAKYIDEHVALSSKMGKPVVIEEFGYPRDGFSFSKQSTTSAREQYYEYIFSRVINSKKENGILAGCNFWAWGGNATPEHTMWHVGDNYCGDPAQEAQGLNSVFTSDVSTIGVIKKVTSQLSK
ncbi:MAG: cellulase family glycosylhydrolase [Flavobacteriales bacterium]|nr:cellulase family glycosylhydrolase [Flavobacteriales bacterium]